MIVVFIFLIIVISLFIEIFRFYRVKANVFSKDEVKQAAREQVRKIRIKDPEISCEYCGCKVDTSKYKVCPQCGAPYDKDPEWIAKFDVKASFVDKSTNNIIEELEEKEKKESDAILKGIKTRIKILVIANVLFLLLGVVGIISSLIEECRGDEEVNSERYDKFEEVSYKVDGDGVIYDDDKVKITVAGIYVEPQDNRREYNGVSVRTAKVGFTIENKSDENVRVLLYCNSINGISSDANYINMYDTYKKHKTVTVYERISWCPGDEIYEMIFNRVEANTFNHDYYAAADKPVKINTTSKQGLIEYSNKDTKLVYSDDKVDVYAALSDDVFSWGYKLSIINKSDKDFIVDSSDLKIDGSKYTTYGIIDTFIAAGYVLNINQIYSPDEDFDLESISKKDVKISLTFTCKEEPSFGYSTEFFELNE